MDYYWISLSWATFGIAAHCDEVIVTAPIAWRVRGMQINEALEYYRRRGARIVELEATCQGRPGGTGELPMTFPRPEEPLLLLGLQKKEVRRWK
jgi:hypothetical protein